MVQKTALITGISGQDGCYLTSLLLRKGYRILGWTRDTQSPSIARFHSFLREQGHSDDLISAIPIYQIDMLDRESVSRELEAEIPDEVYNLAGQSRPKVSFHDPIATFHANATAVANLLEAVRYLPDGKRVRLFQAGSAEMYAGANESPQHIKTPFSARSPYGASKIAAHSMVVAYRESFGLHACNGILYSHESPLRTADFVTGKIVDGVARIALGRQQELVLGNLDVVRDWGFAGDFAEAMYLMLQQQSPTDFIIATGQSHSLTDFLNVAFATVGLDWEQHVRSEADLMRPVEPVALVGDAGPIESQLSWRPTTSFEVMIELMVRDRLLRLRGTT